MLKYNVPARDMVQEMNPGLVRTTLCDGPRYLPVKSFTVPLFNRVRFNDKF